jgi:hypothetical protein
VAPSRPEENEGDDDAAEDREQRDRAGEPDGLNDGVADSSRIFRRLDDFDDDGLLQLLQGKR